MPDEKYIIGITGGIGSGKSTVANLFRERGFHIIDADDVARDVVKPGSELLIKITTHFGKDILNRDGSLNRAKLASIVFQNQKEREYLEQILHPKIISQIIIQIEKADVKTVIIVVPLLIESGMDKLCDLVIVVIADVETRITRIEKRNTVDRDEILSRINAQISDTERSENADIIIDNNSDVNELARQVDKVITKIS
ncbi:dephospho-CoA kinase [bacterium]|nr:dephospho-CoA kinase [bacterium]